MPMLLAMLIGVLLLGRLQDLEGQVIATSRYDAFRRAEISSGALRDDRSQVLARAWSVPAAPLREDDRLTDAGFRAGASDHWRVPLSRAWLLRDASAVQLERSAAGLGDAPGIATEVAVGVGQTAGVIGAGRFDLRNDGFLSSVATARVGPPQLPWPLNRLELELRAPSALLANAWSSSGPDHVVRRVEPFMPSSGLAQVARALQPVQLLISVIEPDFRRLCIGHIDVEDVPSDRLLAQANEPAGAWRPACR
jgi:hypothetical protein